MKIIDVELHNDHIEPCFVCEEQTHAYVPEYGAWLCFRCFQVMTSVVVIADQMVDEIKEKLDVVDAMYSRHDNN